MGEPPAVSGVEGTPKRRRRALPLLLLLAALGAYAVSLGVPAANVNPDSLPGAACDNGLEVLRTTFNPVSWIMVIPLPYVLVNVLFALSPFLLWVRDPARSGVGLVLVVLYALSAAAAWAALAFLEHVCGGFYLWAASHTLVALAFFVDWRTGRSR
jgi:hypothetical protein